MVLAGCTKIVSLVAIPLALAALACVGEEPPAPAAPSAGEIEKLVTDSVNASVSQAVADSPRGASAREIREMVEAAVQASARPGITRAEVEAAVTASLRSAGAGQLTPAEVRSIVDAEVEARSAQEIDVSAIRGLVQDAVANSAHEGVSAGEIARLVDEAVRASTAGLPTRDELSKSIEDAVSEALSARLTASDVQAIVDASMMAAGQAPKTAAGAMDAAMMGPMESMSLMIDLPPVMDGYTRTIVPVFSFERDVRSPRPWRAGMTLDRDQSVTMASAEPVEHVVPGRMDSYGTAWSQWVFMSPFILGHDGRPRAALAVAYDVNAGATSYVLHLDPGAVFHDGSPVTAAAVKASWEFDSTPGQQSPWGGIVAYTQNIVGGEAVVNGDAAAAEGLIALDDRTLRIDLVAQNRLFPLEMAASWMGVHKGHEQSRTGSSWTERPIGVGPFQVAYDPATGAVDLTPAPSWWKSDPPRPSVTYRIRYVPDLQAQETRFRDGEIDVALPFGDVLLPTHDLNADLLTRKSPPVMAISGEGNPGSDIAFMVQPWLRNWDHLANTAAFYIGMPYWKVATRNRNNPNYYR